MQIRFYIFISVFTRKLEVLQMSLFFFLNKHFYVENNFFKVFVQVLMVISKSINPRNSIVSLLG